MMLHKEFDWWVTKSGWKAKLKKWFPDYKDMSTEKLKKQKRKYSILQLFWLLYAVFAVAPLVFGLRVESICGLAISGASLGFIGFSFSMYAQFRVYEAEVGFELRLREILAAKIS